MKRIDIHIRGWLYVAIAMLVAAKDELQAVVQADAPSLSGYQWAIMGITVLVAGCTTLRAYLDQSISKVDDKATTKTADVAAGGSGGGVTGDA